MENETKKENSVRIFDQDGVCCGLDEEILERWSKPVLANDSCAWIEHPRIEYQKRLVCEYCGCISNKDHGTCEHCGAVLTEPKSADLAEVMKRWW